MGCNVSNIIEKKKEEYEKIIKLKYDESISLDDDKVLLKTNYFSKSKKKNGYNKKITKKYDQKAMSKEIVKTAKLKEIDDYSFTTFPEDETFYNIPETMSDLDYGYELVKI